MIGHMLLVYLRLLLYPLAILGFSLQVANEYTGARDWRRIAVLLGPVILMSWLMAMNILDLTSPGLDTMLIRDFTLTPIIIYMCVTIWLYILGSRGGQLGKEVRDELV